MLELCPSRSAEPSLNTSVIPPGTPGLQQVAKSEAGVIIIPPVFICKQFLESKLCLPVQFNMYAN